MVGHYSTEVHLNKSLNENILKKFFLNLGESKIFLIGGKRLKDLKSSFIEEEAKDDRGCVVGHSGVGT